MDEKELTTTVANKVKEGSGREVMETTRTAPETRTKSALASRKQVEDE